MGKCGICGRNDEGLSLLSANHKDLGYIMICQDCWQKLYVENRMVCSTGSGGTCPTCR